MGLTEERFLVRSPSCCCTATAAPSERCIANKEDACWLESLFAVEDEDAGALPRDFERDRGGGGTTAWRLLNAGAAGCDEGTSSAVLDVEELGWVAVDDSSAELHVEAAVAEVRWINRGCDARGKIYCDSGERTCDCSDAAADAASAPTVWPRGCRVEDMTSSSRAASHSSCCDAGGLDGPSEAKNEPALTDDGGGREVTALEGEFKTDPFLDKCACDGDKPLVFDRLGSPDRGCGGGLDRSVRGATSGGRLRSRCGSMTTSFSGEAELGVLKTGSAAWFEHELIAKVSCES